MKIAVIGAGPGGLYAALAAANKGMKVDVFEKRKVGEGIVCGECIFDSLRLLPKPGRGLLRPVHQVVLKGRAPYPFALFKHRPLWMLDRQTWQQDLARQAASRGVSIVEHSTITASRLREMQREYDWIIDASGAPSVTSRRYRFSAAYFRDYLLAYQYVVKGDFSGLWPNIQFSFLPDMPTGCRPAYAWIFPKDEHTANVGVVCTVFKTLHKTNVDLKKRLTEFLHAEGPADATVVETGGGMATGRMPDRLVYDNILLAGDAAGLTSALSGGGIDLACLSGVLAVSAIREGKNGVDGYEKKLQDYIKERTALEKVAIRKMRHMNFNQLDALLGGVTSPNKFIRLKTGLRHPDMLYTTFKWFGAKKAIPDWPV